MFYAYKWLVRKHPEVLVMLLGVWIASVPLSLFWCVLNFDWKNVRGTALDRLLRDIYNLPHAQQVATVIWFIGWGVALVGLFMGAYRAWIARRKRQAGRPPA